MASQEKITVYNLAGNQPTILPSIHPNNLGN